MTDPAIDLASERPFILGGLEVRPSTREVRGPDGGVVSAEPRVMQVLTALVQAGGEVVSRDALIARCWAGRVVGEDAINRAVAKTRQLAELTDPPAFAIETIARVGYRLTPARAADEQSPSAPPPAPPPEASIEPPFGSPPAGRLARGRRLPWLAGALGLVAAVLALAAFLRPGAPPPPAASATRGAAIPKVTVLPFQALGDGDAELRRFVGGLQAEMVNGLNQGQVGVVEPAQATSAAYGFGGVVERDGGDIVVRIKLDDLRQHVTVWSDEVRNTARNADALQKDAANLAAHVATAATRNDALAKGDTETMGLLIRKTLFALRNKDEAREEEWDVNKQLLAKLPGDPWTHANFAIVSSFLAPHASPARAAELRRIVADETAIVLRLDPKNDQAYFARYLITPMVGRWPAREATLQAGLKATPQSLILTNHYSNFLREVGRLSEAVEWGGQAAAGRPPSANRDATLLLALAGTDRTAEIAEAAGRIAGAYPTHRAAWNSRFEAFLLHGRWSEALALLEPGADQSSMDEAERAAWSLGLKAMKAGDAAGKRRAIAAFLALRPPSAFLAQPPHETYGPGERIGMVALLGGTDEAFALASVYLQKDAYADSGFLFWPALADFRRDKRFAALAGQTGLTAYWKAVGKWPDFCADKALGYDCRAWP